MGADDGAVEEHHAECEAAPLLHQPKQPLPDPEPGPADEGLRRLPPRAELLGISVRELDARLAQVAV